MVSLQTPVCEFGTPAIDFALPGVDGKGWTLQQCRGDKGLLVMFICNHCPYVKHINDKLAELTGQWIDRGLAVVGISSNDVVSHPDDSPKQMAAVVTELGYRFPYLHDDDQSVAKAYRAACTPDFFLFDSAHKLVYRGQFDSTRPGSGTPTGEDLRTACDAVLAGNAPAENQTPSLGRNIKWKPGSEPEYFG